MLNKIQKYVYVYLLTSIRPLWWKLSVTGISKDFCMNITDIVWLYISFYIYLILRKAKLNNLSSDMIPGNMVYGV